MKLLTKATGIFDRTLNVLAVVAGILVVGTMLLVTAEVIMRHFFNRPIVWVIEIIQYALVFITFLAAAWLLRKEGHVIMDLLVNRLSAKSRDLANVITSTVAAIMCLVVTWFGIVVGVDYYQIDYIYQGTLTIPSFYLEAVVPLGTLLLSIQFLRRAYGYLGKLRAL